MKQFLFLIITLLLITSCVTQKRRSEASGIKKLYHDITAEFNGYFNAVERVKLATTNLSKQTPANYNKLLPIYPYVEVENPAAVASDLDEAIKKVTVVNALHEPSHWMDDCYLLAGKAQYLKQDYEAAEETLEYLLREFSPQAKLQKAKNKAKSGAPKSQAQIKKERAVKEKERAEVKKEKEKTAAQKRKEYNKQKKQRERERAKARNAKKKGKPVAPKPSTAPVVETPVEPTAPVVKEPSKKEQKKQQKEEEDLLKLEEPQGTFKHHPAFQEGQLWLARTYIERDKYDQAAYLLRQLNEKKNIYPEVAEELAPLTAYFFLKQKQYDEAIAPLERAVKMADNNNDKARYAYILAQLQEQKGNSSEAYNYYSRVIKLRPDYEMEFNARMSMIINEYQSGKTTAEGAINQLERLLKDEKNIDYFDRIYFAIAEVYLKNNNEAKGVEYLELALQQEGSSRVQQGETYLKLARIYYQKENYLKASDHYTKALAGLSKSDDRYLEVEGLSSSLKDIASRIQTITLQDSLLKISAMSIDEKRTFAFDLKKKQDEERREALKKAATAPPANLKGQVAARRVTAATPGAGPSALASSTKSNWFAYDDRALKRGKRDFAQRWGQRPLEDDWRRSNRAGVGIVASTDTTTQQTQSNSTSGLLSDDQVATVLKGVPQSKTQIEESENTLMTALFELAVLYRDRLKNLEKSVTTFEQLLARFPDTKYKAEAMYYLYLLHKELGNPINAQNYFDRLVAEFPNSIYAKILSDPDYLAKIEDEKRQLNNFYDNTYALFTSGNHQGAFNNLQQVESKFGANNPLQPRFALLTAMTLGSLEGKEAYVRTLKEVIAKYPNTDEQKRAREILRLLGETSGGLAGTETASGETKFVFEPEETHYIIIALEPSASLTDAKVVVSDFNKKYYKLENLRITNIFLENEGKERTPLIVIRRFKTQKEAMDYYQNTNLNTGDFLENFDYQIFPVTQNNYSEIIKNRNLEAYKAFFEDKYL